MSTHSRNALVEQHLPLVRKIAARIHARLPPGVCSADDLVSVGALGLMEALADFDPARGCKVGTYCTPRVRGRILDELRRIDAASRRTRAQANRIAAAREALGQALGRRPSAAEVAGAFGPGFEAAARHAAAVAVVGLHDAPPWDDRPAIQVVENPRAEDPTAGTLRLDLDAAIERHLSPRERLAVRWYFFDGVTMSKIGRRLGVCESRVSQMISRALRTLRRRLDNPRSALE